MKPRILIVDDDNLVCTSLKRLLVKLNFEVDICLEGERAIEKIEQFYPDVVLLDIYLTSVSGLDILKDIQAKHAGVPIIMITGYADVNIAVEAMKSGAYDFLLKPLDIDQLQLVVNRAIENLNLKSEVEKLHELHKQDILTREYFGKSPKILNLVKSVEKIAQSSDTTMLIEGESGVGKEVFAKYIHQQSPRKDNVFIQINCATIPKELAESELFGHEKGAFTGASQKTKLGKFELAEGGTILLDEIGELSLELQVKLLRVLQEKKFFRVGGEKEVSIDVRVLAATNRNLEDEIKKGNFREDLYYRLNVARVIVPPLRERKQDIPYLAYSFLREFSVKFNKDIKGISEEAIKALQAYSWKGNIRELRNIMERALLLLEDDYLQEFHVVPLFDTRNKAGVDSDQFVLKVPTDGIKIDIVLKTLIQKTLEITSGNQVQAAKVLGLSRSKLRYRMEQLGIEVTKRIQ
ncbi:MAG: acetoacetate metabolism regulatory protein AtoC [Melioribacteraceae bacterium]|nr:MAG: acetoacetate metabolism regulatory protein AtoC [Melioribacteraceae bacterium]